MIHLSADVHCHWSENPPSYRIYVDNDLLTERTFKWAGYQIYIREHMVCNLDPGIHTVRIENCAGTGNFKLENLIVEGNPGALHPNHIDPGSKQLTFVVS